MANRNFRDRIWNLENGLVFLQGKLTISAAGAVTAVTGKGIASASLSTTGTYTIVLSDIYTSMLCGNANLQAATAVDLVPQFGAYDVVSAKTVVIRVQTGATATTPSAACELHFSLKLKNSSV